MSPDTSPNMSPDLWTAVDRYLVEQLIPTDPVLEAAREANAVAGLPAIDVSPVQGKLLHLLARMQRAERILEIGTLGGYSTIWLARALPPQGRLVTLEFEAKHAAVARENLQRAGLASQVEMRQGPASTSLEQLHSEGAAPFDMIFVDADKRNNPVYLEWSLRLSRPGSLIVVDNVVRDGKVIDAQSEDADIQGTRRFFEMLAREPRLSATAIQTVGSKGYDGFVLALVTS
jgi:predicted O-methyltransferase YrrM